MVLQSDGQQAKGNQESRSHHGACRASDVRSARNSVSRLGTVSGERGQIRTRQVKIQKARGTEYPSGLFVLQGEFTKRSNRRELCGNTPCECDRAQLSPRRERLQR